MSCPRCKAEHVSLNQSAISEIEKNFDVDPESLRLCRTCRGTDLLDLLKELKLKVLTEKPEEKWPPLLHASRRRKEKLELIDSALDALDRQHKLLSSKAVKSDAHLEARLKEFIQMKPEILGLGDGRIRMEVPVRSKSIDAVFWAEDETVYAIEVKKELSYESVGQALVYASLLGEEYTARIRRKVEPVVVCLDADADILKVANKIGIKTIRISLE